MAEDKFVLPPLDTKYHCTNPDREMTLDDFGADA